MFHAQQQSACCWGTLLSPFPPESSFILIALQNQFRQPRFHHTSFPNPTCRCPGRAVTISPTPRLLPAPKRASREPPQSLASPCLSPHHLSSNPQPSRDPARPSTLLGGRRGEAGPHSPGTPAPQLRGRPRPPLGPR